MASRASRVDMDALRLAYEEGRDSVEVVAVKAGISQSYLYELAHREGWRLRRSPKGRKARRRARKHAATPAGSARACRRATVGPSAGPAGTPAGTGQAVCTDARCADASGEKAGRGEAAGGGAIAKRRPKKRQSDRRPVDRADMLRRLMRLTGRQIEEIEARLGTGDREGGDAERDARLIGALAKTLDVIAAASRRQEVSDKETGAAVDLDALRTELAERLEALRRAS